jgi:hypothetical protein
MSTEKEAFDEWAAFLAWRDDYSRHSDPCAWPAWQARAALEGPPAPSQQWPTPPSEPERPESVPWPVVDSYSGGADHAGIGGRVWLRMGDGPETVEYVPAASLPSEPEQPEPVALPFPGSPEASAMIDSLLNEYGWPANTKNAARAGFEAARRMLATPPQPQPQPLTLSDEQIREVILQSVYEGDGTVPYRTQWSTDIGIPFARAVLAAAQELR